MPTLLLRYRWRYFDPVRQKHCSTKYHATQDEMLVRHPDATPVAGTEEVLILADDPLSSSMSKFQVGVLGR